jgi:hypothetical protein
VRRTKLEEQVFEALASQLMQPELLAEFTTAFIAEWNSLAAETAAKTGSVQGELAVVERQLATLIDRIAEGLTASSLQARLNDLETRRTSLRAAAAATPVTPPALHPNLAELYRRKVAALHRSVTAEDAPDALEAARALIDRVLVTPPNDDGDPPGFELVGALQAMLQATGVDGAASKSQPTASFLGVFACSVKEASGREYLPSLTLLT